MLYLNCTISSIYSNTLFYLQLLVDDLLVYNGNLQAVTQGARGIIPGVSAPQKYHTILFTDNKEILRKEKHTVIR